MPRVPVNLRAFAVTMFLIPAMNSPARAQGGYVPPKRIELTPFGS